MNNFLIITNEKKDNDFQVTNEIAAYINKHEKNVVLSTASFAEDWNTKGIPKDIECAIVLGGDGTIIQAANDLMTYQIPILGVNLGTVGFLAEIEENHVFEALDSLFHDQYKIDTRLMIQGELLKEGVPNTDLEIQGYALNDIVITRKGFSRVIRLGIYVNDELVDNFRGDGVIISTPTGSTAYNLSAGGPIITPQANAMVITPICPHSMRDRSIVVSAEDVIKVVVEESKKTQEAEAIATFNGNKVIELGMEDVLCIKKARYQTRLIKLNHTSIYEILRSKLGHNQD